MFLLKRTLLVATVFATLASVNVFAEDTAPGAEAEKPSDVKSDLHTDAPKSNLAKPDAKAAKGAKAAPVTDPAVAHTIDTKAETKAHDLEYGKQGNILGPVAFGPSISLLGFPHPFEVAGEAKFKNMFGLQATYGFLPKIKFKDASAKMNDWDVRLRWFPFGGAFFIGGAYGNQTVTGTATRTISGYNVEATAEVKNKFFTPQLGWRWTWNSGFFMGLDLGWQIASGAVTTTSSTVNGTVPPAAVTSNADYAKAVADVTKTGTDLGNKALPSLTLLHFGFLF